MDYKIKKYCSNCSQVYTIDGIKSNQKRRIIPLLLPCGHSMCFACIIGFLNFTEPIECKICSHTVEAPGLCTEKNITEVCRQFPIDLYTLGEMSLPLIDNTNNFPNSSSDGFYVDLKNIIESLTPATGCIECNAKTSKMCKQCGSVLCTNCFNKMHKSFQSLRNHKIMDIVYTPEDKVCSIHPHQILSYYCNDCQKSICMDCMVVGGDKSCKNHSLSSLQEKNTESIAELKILAPKVEETYKRLTNTAVQIGNILSNLSTEDVCDQLQVTEKGIQNSFLEMHGILQLHEREIMKVLGQWKNVNKESLLKAKNDITASIHKAINVNSNMNALFNPTNKVQINVLPILEEAKEILDIPWFLSKCDANNLKYTVNKDLVESVRDYIRVEGDCQSTYNLLATKDISETTAIPPAPAEAVFPPTLLRDVREPVKTEVQQKEFFYNVPKFRVRSGSSSSSNTMTSETSSKHFSHHSFEELQPQRVQHVMPNIKSELMEGSQETVYVTHIIDPFTFYVQRSVHQGLVTAMIKEFRNASSFPKPSINQLQPGKTFMFYNKADKQWSRCKIISIDTKVPNSPIYHVFGIDFGNMDAVSQDKLRFVPAIRQHSPAPLAIHCTLANCKPLTGTWTSDDAMLMQNIIDNKQLVIHVRRTIHMEHSLIIECDLTTFQEGISLAHAFVFHERARLANPHLKYPHIKTLDVPATVFSSISTYKLNSTENVEITHIVNPDKFFVRKQYLNKTYENICSNLENEYSLASSTRTVYLPQVGMVCVVNIDNCVPADSGLGGWVRGVVCGLPGRRRVAVRLPDTGHSFVVHYASLRYIQSRHTQTNALAVECHLSNITPLNRKWSTSSVEYLGQFYNQILELHVNETNDTKESLGVTLYYSDDMEGAEKLCVNKEMIKKKFAITIGMCDVYQPKVTEKTIIRNELPIDKMKKQKRKKSPNVVATEELDLEAKDKGPIKIEVKVLAFQSPSLLYVTLADQQDTHKELYNLIQAYYNENKVCGREEWQIGEKCCTMSQESKTYRRALITELTGTEAKVFFIDFASFETVDVAHLLELPAKFQNCGNASIKCHLSGVVPANDDRWPSLTIEYFRDLLKAYNRFFITKNGKIKNNSLPIEMWVYHIIECGALEPNKAEWRCLNKNIIEQGLGVPEKLRNHPNDSEGENTNDSDIISFLSQPLQQWHHMSPAELVPAEPNIDPPQQPEVISPESTPTTEMHNLGNNMKSPLSITQEFASDWLPPEPFTETSFLAIPTNVDNEGHIYLHAESQEETYDIIKKALEGRYKDSKAPRVANWSIGQPCIAKFYLDKAFYRARIVDVNKQLSYCIVRYTDYGNEEKCAFSDLREQLLLLKIPTQAQKCFLSDIVPVSGIWARDTLDYIHKMIVEKKCLVEIKGDKVNGVIPIHLKFNMLWMHEHLVEFTVAKFTKDIKPVGLNFGSDKLNESSDPDYIIEDDCSEQSTNSDFKPIEPFDWSKSVEDEDEVFWTYPKNVFDGDFMCEITVINSLDQLNLTLVLKDDLAEKYKTLSSQLQSVGGNSIYLTGVYEKKACIAKFEEDGLWYRALMLEYSQADKLIKVRYIDFGNLAIVPFENVRETTAELCELPPATVLAKLHKVTINKDIEPNKVLEECSNVFLNSGPFSAKVIGEIDGILNVELVNPDNGMLVYQNLINNNIFLKDATEFVCSKMDDLD